MKIRRFLRRLVHRLIKPAAMVAIAGGVALSLVVTTPTNAQALVAPIPPPVIAGAAEMVLPELIPAASILGPVGWGIAAVTVVGVGLYATKDYWLPYVTGAFGGGKDSQPSTVNTGTYTPSILPNWHLSYPVVVSGVTITIPANYACPSTCSVNAHVAAHWQCKHPTTGALTDFKSVSNYTFSTSASQPTTPQYGVSCRTTTGGVTVDQIPVAAEFGIAGDGNLPPLKIGDKTGGPVEHVYWGTFKPGAFDPHGSDVKYTTSVECIRPDGTKFTLAKDSTGADGALAVPSCEQASAGSHATGKMDVVGTPPASSGQSATTLLHRDAPAPSTDKPLCGPTIPGQGCKLQVLLDSAPCVMGTWECAHWLDLSKDPNQSTRLSCQYGPYMVPLSTCNPLERAYEEGGAPATDANTDGNTSTRSDTDPNGNQVPKTSTDVGVVPGSAGSPDGVAGGASADESECWPSGWGMLNPLEWVYRPVVCASKALFEPKKDIQQRVTDMQGQFADKVPVSWFGVTAGQVGASGCPTDWAIDYDGHRYSLICGTPADDIIRGFRPVLAGMLIMAAVWPLIRSLFYAAIPIFKVTPS